MHRTEDLLGWLHYLPSVCRSVVEANIYAFSGEIHINGTISPFSCLSGRLKLLFDMLSPVDEEEAA